MTSFFTSCILLHHFIDIICIIGIPCCTPYIGVIPKYSRVLVERVVHRQLGTTGLMMFMKFDQGAVLHSETGLNTPKIVRYVIGNPPIMKELTKHILDASAYASVTILVNERPDGVQLCI